MRRVLLHYEPWRWNWVVGSPLAASRSLIVRSEREAASGDRSVWIPPGCAQSLHIGRIRTMSRMQRPAVVGCDEWPCLRWQSDRTRVVLDVTNSPPNLVGMVEEHFPAAASNPGRMRLCSFAPFDQPVSAGEHQVGRHVLCQMLVLANENVHVIGHDRAGIASVTLFVDNAAKSV